MIIRAISLVLLPFGQLGAARAVNTGNEQEVLTPAKGLTDMPLLGFGTWNLDRGKGPQAVSTAIQAGYRHIDAAKIYGNEIQTGEGIATGLHFAGISRSDIWVTSKLWNDAHSPDAVPAALNQTLADLDLDYLDLYLMHWPVAKDSDGNNAIDFKETWTAMEALLDTGRVRHIGVSNFSPAQLDALLEHANVVPYAHQFETHPYLPQSEFIEYHARLGIRVTAYSPLGNTNPTYTAARKGRAAKAVPPLLDNPEVKRIAHHRDCTPAQVALAWGIARDTAVIPKATSEEHIVENYAAWACKLKHKDIKKLAKDLPVKRFNNPSKTWGVKLFLGLEDSHAEHLSQAWGAVLVMWHTAAGYAKKLAAEIKRDL